MILQQISTQVGMMSCVGIGGEFPYKRGNYCSVGKGGCEFYLCNLWAENLEHLVETGVLDGKMDALIFDDEGRKTALIVDKRIPEGVLHKPYFCGIRTNVDVLRHYYEIPDDTCVCEHDVNLVSWNCFSYKPIKTKSGKCPQCGTDYKVHQNVKR